MISLRLLDWYSRHGRDLPWRRTRDPYAILVSEIMLQQTQVERVIPKYLEFLDFFPTLQRLSEAPRAEVIRRWSPLGYNRRAVRLHEIAREVVRAHGGVVPCSYDALLSLPGVGSYTAAAVACFAYGANLPTIDTNLRRVLARLLIGVDGAAIRPRAVEQLALAALPRGRAGDWNQALMDLGATHCGATSPRCSDCPLANLCLARGKLGAPGQARRLAAERRAVYAVQAPFEGSSRFYRGRVVEVLRALPDNGQLGLTELGSRLRPDYGPELAAWLRELVGDLASDGLVELDVDRPGDEARVSLPR